MNRNILSFVRKALNDQRGQVLPWVAVGMVGFLGMSGLAIDLGHAFVVRSQLQGSTNAAALAAVEGLTTTTTAAQTQAIAAAYGSDSGGANAIAGLGTVTTNATQVCLTSLNGVGCITTGNGSANGVRVKQSVNVPTYLLGVVGINSIAVSATATASFGKPVPYNVAIIVDSTLSMNDSDNNCGDTQMHCALSGVQQLLKGLAPSIDHVSLFTFPNVTTDTVQNDYNCTGSPPTDPAFWDPTQWSGGSPQVDSKLANAAAYTIPTPNPTAATGYSSLQSVLPNGTTVQATYQVVGFSNDYRTSDAATALSSSSNLVKAAGNADKSVHGCLAPSNYDGDYGTYYPGAIYAAQAALLAEQANNPNSKNVIIVLGDGYATTYGNVIPSTSTIYNASPLYLGSWVPKKYPGTPLLYNVSMIGSPAGSSYASLAAYSSTNGEYNTASSWAGECAQAILAAQYAANSGTKVFAVSYGALLSGCTSDSTNFFSTLGLSSPYPGTYQNISPCTTMQDIASNPDYFYSDVSGGDAGCTSSNNNNTTDLSGIFKSISARLTGARLIPNGTT